MKAIKEDFKRKVLKAQFEWMESIKSGQLQRPSDKVDPEPNLARGCHRDQSFDPLK